MEWFVCYKIAWNPIEFSCGLVTPKNSDSNNIEGQSQGNQYNAKISDWWMNDDLNQNEEWSNNAMMGKRLKYLGGMRTDCTGSTTCEDLLKNNEYYCPLFVEMPTYLIVRG